MENQINLLPIYEKRSKSTKKSFTEIKAQENPFQTDTIILDNNHFTEIIFAEDLQTEEIHKTFRKTHIADQTIGTISIA